MKAKQQQGQEWIQGELFTLKDLLRPYGKGGPVKAAKASEERQPITASEEMRALTMNLMEKVCERHNLNQAYKRVKANKGAPGIDGMSVQELGAWLKLNKDQLVASLKEGSYQPSGVKGVRIPKPGGGERQLGIPTVLDRLVQQALLQVLEPIFDSKFSASSFGFRRGRSAHGALKQASHYVAEGRNVVVDCDLEKFFDQVNHDVLMSRVARWIGDRRVLCIIRRYLTAGMLANGVTIQRYKGTPQGGPLSPLLANLLLDDLDKELEKRGHKFCRYADDVQIYVGSFRSGERVMKSITWFLEGKLKLRVNREKSAVANVWERPFLGYQILKEGRLWIAPKSVQRAKRRVREITRRNRPKTFQKRIEELNAFLAGWVTYFRLCTSRSRLKEMDSWIRRKLRCVRLKECKRTHTICLFLMKLKVREGEAWKLALSGKGWWRLSNSPQANRAMSLDWFQQQGLVSLASRFDPLAIKRNRHGT